MAARLHFGDETEAERVLLGQPILLIDRAGLRAYRFCASRISNRQRKRVPVR